MWQVQYTSWLVGSQSKETGSFIKMCVCGGGEKWKDTINKEKPHRKAVHSMDVFVGSRAFWEKASPPLYITFFLIKHLKRRLPPGKRQPAYS